MKSSLRKIDFGMKGLCFEFEEVRIYIFRSSSRRDLMARGVCMCVSVSQSVKLLVGLHTFSVVHIFKCKDAGA